MGLNHRSDQAFSFDRLQKRSLKDEVFEFLHHKIVAGEYQPGKWLRQEEISAQLGVSHTPVREALDRLVTVGLAERVPYRGVRVPDPEPEAILEAYILRLILESAAVRLAAENISPQAIQELTRILEEMKDLLSLEEMSKLRLLNKEFHQAIVEASGNALLGKLYEMASNLFPDWRLYEYMFRHPELLHANLSRENKQHLAIVQALAEGQADRAVAATRQHITELGGELVDYLGIPTGLLREKENQISLFLSPDNPGISQHIQQTRSTP